MLCGRRVAVVGGVGGGCCWWLVGVCGVCRWVAVGCCVIGVFAVLGVAVCWPVADSVVVGWVSMLGGGVGGRSVVCWASG